uniref:carbonic anhydrase n=1 Tax=Caligus clemensi TaxID=344056 RepID=C1C0I2_CALCM|nr:Carbonic anhydrase 6 precursor [Caligus clemensi]
MKAYFVVLSTFILGIQGAPNTEYWESFDVMKICREGQKQSPIDIRESKTKAKTGSKITFNGYDTARTFQMKNDGHTAKFVLKDPSVKATITAPHLNNTIYEFAQLHFHWGGENKYGSEHLINGYQAPIEVHLVHFNTNYGDTIGEALAKTDVNDNLAVLGILFDIVPCPIFDFNLTTIKEEGSKAETMNLALEKFLPSNIDTFFSYEGSLTTPRCQEVVAWTVFESRNQMSQAKLEQFRKLMAGNKPLVNNYRSTQPLNGRKVSLYTKKEYFNLKKYKQLPYLYEINMFCCW